MCLSLLIFSATFVIAEVMVPVMVTEGVGGDNHPPRRGFEIWIIDNGELTTDHSKTSQKIRPKYAGF